MGAQLLNSTPAVVLVPGPTLGPNLVSLAGSQQFAVVRYGNLIMVEGVLQVTGASVPSGATICSGLPIASPAAIQKIWVTHGHTGFNSGAYRMDMQNQSIIYQGSTLPVGTYFSISGITYLAAN